MAVFQTGVQKFGLSRFVNAAFKGGAFDDSISAAIANGIWAYFERYKGLI